MLQISENDNDHKVYARAKARKQRTFTLVEQDRSAVECIAYWILQNIHTAPPKKLRDALEDCIIWREYSAVKNSD